MSDIVTITLNPAVDISTSVERVIPVAKLRGDYQQHDAGGGGINVARVVTRFGGDVTALYPVGGATGALLRSLLDKEGIASLTWPTAEETRQDFFIHESATDQAYRFILPGPSLSEPEWQACLTLLKGLEPFPRYVVASGSLPHGVPTDFYVRVAEIARHRGAQMILDTSGPPLAAAIDGGVDLIKPSLREMRECTGGELADAATWEAAAHTLIRAGKVSTVALTMGHLGAVIVQGERVLHARPLPIKPINAVGAGDSFLGVLVTKLAAGEPLEEAFRWAAAAGAAALLHAGTTLCDIADVTRLAAEVVLETA